MQISTLNELHTLKPGAYKFIIIQDTTKQLLGMLIGPQIYNDTDYFHEQIAEQFKDIPTTYVLGGGRIYRVQNDYSFEKQSNQYGPVSNELCAYLINKRTRSAHIGNPNNIQESMPIINYINPNTEPIVFEYDNKQYLINIDQPSLAISNQHNPRHVDNIPKELAKDFENFAKQTTKNALLQSMRGL